MPELIISDVTIHQDSENRYCLNDLHKAAGNEPKHKPANWLRLDQTQALIEVVNRCSEMRNAVNIMQGGTLQGTFAVKPLVYAYAMWISPEFNLVVINTYDALVTGKIPSFLLPVTTPMAFLEVEAHSKKLHRHVDELVKKIPVVGTMEEWEKVKNRKFFKSQSQASIPGMDEMPDLNGLPLAEQFNILLELHLDKHKADGSNDNTLRSLRSTYRKRFAETGKIPDMLLGNNTSGRKSTLSPEIKQRFIEFVKASADETSTDYLPLNERKITYFQFLLEDEFKQQVTVKQLYAVIARNDLKRYFSVKASA